MKKLEIYRALNVVLDEEYPYTSCPMCHMTRERLLSIHAPDIRDILAAKCFDLLRFTH